MKDLDQLKSRLIKDISHELRTPITSLNLYLDLLDRAAPEKAERYRQVLRLNTDRLMHLSEAILNVERLDINKENMQFEVVDLNDIAANVVQQYQSWVTAVNLKLLFQPAPDNLPQILANGRQSHPTNEAKRTKKALKTRQEASNKQNQGETAYQLSANGKNGVDQAAQAGGSKPRYMRPKQAMQFN